MQYRRTRRRMLELVDAAKAGGGLRGKTLHALLEDLSPEAPVDRAVTLVCLQDLANAELVRLVDRRSQLPCNVNAGLDHLVVQITDKGTCLLQQAIAPHPLVEDPRNL